MPKFSDIRQMTKTPGYMVNVPWQELPHHIQHLKENRRLELTPPFQRCHVWTDEDKKAYLEYGLKGGLSGRDVYLNARHWGTGEAHPLVLVDGLQRITAVLEFVEDKFPVFGYLFSEYEDKLGFNGPCFNWHVNDLPTMQMVIDWYVELNTSGRPHTKAEIDVAKRMRGEYSTLIEYYTTGGSFIGTGHFKGIGEIVRTNNPKVVYRVESTDRSLEDRGLIKIYCKKEVVCSE